MKLGRNVKFIAILGAVMLLAACGSGPSEAEMKAALEAQYQALRESRTTSTGGVVGNVVAAMARDTMPTKVEFTLHKIGCKETGENAYTCDYELTGKGAETSKVGTSRFLKGSKGWVSSWLGS